MSRPQDPWSGQNEAQWQNPAGTYPAPPSTAQYHVNQVGQGSFAMPPLSPVLPQEVPPERPPTVTAATWIWIAGAVLSVAVMPVLFLSNAESFLTDNGLDSRRERDAGQTGLRFLALMSGFGMLVGATPYVIGAIMMLNGRAWARILLTILGALGLLSMIAILFVGLAAPAWQPAVTIVIVVMGLTVAAVVLQFLPPSNRFIR